MDRLITKELKTERLTLKVFNENDTKEMYTNWLIDENTAKHTTWKKYENFSEALERMVQIKTGYNSEGGKLLWGIVYEGKLIGSIDAVRTKFSPYVFSLGYCIGSKWWNKGIVTEAVSKIMEFVFNEYKANKISACHDIINAGSGKVMLKNNMIYEGTDRQCILRKDGTHGDLIHYGILRNEYFSKIKLNKGA